MSGEYWRQLTWMVAADTETAGVMCAPDTGRKMVVRVATASPATSPQYAWLVTCEHQPISAQYCGVCVVAPPMRGEYHLAAVRAGGGHQADQQRVEEGGDTLRGQRAPEREGPATTNQVSVFRA